MDHNLKTILNDLRARLHVLTEDAEWYRRKSREVEEKIIAYKNQIAELETL